MAKPSAVKGNQALAGLKRRLRTLPVSLAHEVARDAAPLLTRLTRVAFDSGRNVYGEARDARHPSATGKPLTLVKTGATRDTLRFATAGTIVRCVLAHKYQRYLIGKYGILPNGALPTWWERQLNRLVTSAVQRHMAGRAVAVSRAA